MKIERRIYFYAASLLNYSSTSNGTVESPSDPYRVMDAISRLDWDESKPVNAYQVVNDGSIAIRVGKLSTNYAMGQLAKIRKVGLPPVVRAGGAISPLRLGADEGLYEAAHFGLFWDQGIAILAMEMNPYAPRQARLGSYMEDKLLNHPSAHLDSAKFRPMIRGDALDQLLAAGPLAEIELFVRRDAVTALQAAGHKSLLGDALVAQAEATDEMETVGIYFHRGHNKKRGGAGPELKEALVNLVGDIFPFVRRARAKVERDETGKGKLLDLDLLADKWIHEVTVPRTSDRMIDSEAFFDQILEAYSPIALDLVKSEADLARSNGRHAPPS